MSEEWHYARDGVTRGPISATQLRDLVSSGEVSSDDLVWSDGLSDWTRISKVTDLFAPQTGRKNPPPLPINAPSKTPNARSIRCPNCTSDNVQSFKVIFEMGTSEIAATTAGTVFGAGLGTGAIGGVTSATTRGSQQTAAAKSAAPPPKRELIAAFLGILAGATLGLFGLLACQVSLEIGLLLIFIGAPLAAAAYYSYIQDNQWNLQEWPLLYSNWLSSFRCLKCGKVFARSSAELASSPTDSGLDKPLGPTDNEREDVERRRNKERFEAELRAENEKEERGILNARSELRRIWFSRSFALFNRLTSHSFLVVRKILDESIGRVLAVMMFLAVSVVAILFWLMAMREIPLWAIPIALLGIMAVISVWFPTDQRLISILASAEEALRECEDSRIIHEAHLANVAGKRIGNSQGDAASEENKNPAKEVKCQ